MVSRDALRPEVVVLGGAELGEGPVWDDAAGRLIWVDISGRTVHLYDPETGHDRQVPVEGLPGIAIPRREGGLVLAINHGFAFLRADGTLEEVATVPQRAVDARMNDGNCDAMGRLWAGTMGLREEPGAGALYRLDTDGTVVTMLEGVTVSNGIDWSPDERLMYYVDSVECRVDVFDFDAVSGNIANRRPFVEVGTGEVVPDGLTIDDEGAIWVACWGGGSVRRFTAEGQLERVIELPVTNVTSCAFGGADLGDLYVTSAREGLAETRLEREPHAGALFVCRPGVRGRPQRVFCG